jgi:hypothetical protein
MKMDEIEAMKRAIAAYAAPVMRCAPGKARAKPLRRKKVLDDATRWLRHHRYDALPPKPVDDAEAERGLRRRARAERKRMRRATNAAARKRIREPCARGERDLRDGKRFSLPGSAPDPKNCKAQST